MIVKNDYNECITNLVCSISKYFNIDYSHNTLSYVDDILNEYKPKNVVLLLFDGMGSNIIDRVLDKNAFLIKNKYKAIYSVFPATTVAATTSVLTGLNPVETGMLGWDMYYKDIDKTITVFTSALKEDELGRPLEEAKEYNKKHMITKPISERINEKGVDKGYYVSKFGTEKVETIDELFDTVENICNKDGKKYIYGYYKDPDSLMHEFGCDSNEAIDCINDINKRVEELSNKLENTIIFVIADHGHYNVEDIYLKDYPDVEECLLRNTSLEPRAVNFFITDDKKEIFPILFNKYFKDYFDLYTKEDVISSKLFGDGKENEIFKDALGDFIAIAKSNKTLLYIGSHAYKSMHAGYTDDEILVPLIIIKTKK